MAEISVYVDRVLGTGKARQRGQIDTRRKFGCGARDLGGNLIQKCGYGRECGKVPADANFSRPLGPVLIVGHLASLSLVLEVS